MQRKGKIARLPLALRMNSTAPRRQRGWRHPPQLAQCLTRRQGRPGPRLCRRAHHQTKSLRMAQRRLPRIADPPGTPRTSRGFGRRCRRIRRRRLRQSDRATWSPSWPFVTPPSWPDGMTGTTKPSASNCASCTPSPGTSPHCTGSTRSRNDRKRSRQPPTGRRSQRAADSDNYGQERNPSRRARL
jgi:hypothetical protein